MMTVRSMWNIQGQKSDKQGGHEALQRFIDGEYKALGYGRTTQVWVDEKIKCRLLVSLQIVSLRIR